jgi:AmmeMemoRadiSam system protein A
MEVTLSTRLEPRSREILLGTAACAIEARLERRASSPPPVSGLPEELLAERAAFVTLTIDEELRGCCGTLEPRRALALDVWHNAQVSAFNDPRFPPLEFQEWARVDLEISVLSPLERVEVRSELELLRQVVPGEDGLVIAWRRQRRSLPRSGTRSPIARLPAATEAQGRSGSGLLGPGRRGVAVPDRHDVRPAPGRRARPGIGLTESAAPGRTNEAA